MVELHQLQCVVTIIETVRDGGGLGCGVDVHDLDVGSLSVVNNANPSEAMPRVTPPLKDDFAVKCNLAAGSNEDYLASGITEDGHREEVVGEAWKGMSHPGFR